MEVELTIPVSPKILTKLDFQNGSLVFITSSKEEYKELKRTLEDVLESMDNVLKNYW